MYAGGGFFGYAADALGDLGPFLRVRGQALFEQAEEHLPFFVRVRLGIRYLAGLLEFHALVHQHGRVAAVVENHVRTFAVRPGECLFGAPPVFLERFALPSEHRNTASGDGRSGMILGGVDVARGPAHLGAERREGLDQHRGLYRHMQRAGHARSLERFLGGEFLA